MHAVGKEAESRPPSMTEMLQPTTKPVMRLTPRNQRRDVSSNSPSRFCGGYYTVTPEASGIKHTYRSGRSKSRSESRSKSRSKSGSRSRSRLWSWSWNRADDDVHTMPTAQSAEDLKGRADAAKDLKAVAQDVVEKPLSADNWPGDEEKVHYLPMIQHADVDT
eukprot:g17241.t1